MTDFVQPDVTSMLVGTYKASIDQAFMALSQRPMFNRVLNGDWLIDQVNEGSLYTCSGTATQTVDGWTGQAQAPGVFKVRRLTDPDFANQKCLEVTCTTIDATIAAGDLYMLYQYIEGYDVADLRAGMASASKITIAFDMKFSVAGTYGISLHNGALNRHYVATVTQNVANTRESKLVTLTLDTTGTWTYVESEGLQLAICLAAGSTYQGTAGAWGGTAIYTTSSQVNFMSSTSNIGYIGPISLVKGVWPASAFQVVHTSSYSEWLRRCQRHFWKSIPQGTPVTQAAGEAGSLGYVNANTGAIKGGAYCRFPVPMRNSSYGLTFFSPGNPNASWYNFVNLSTSGAATARMTSEGGVLVVNAQAAGDNVAGQFLGIHLTATARLS